MSMFLVAVKMCSLNVDHYKSNNPVCGFRIPATPQPHCTCKKPTHEIERLLLLGRKAMTNLDNILKSRDFTLPTKVCIIRGIFFPGVTYGCESWTIKMAEPWRTNVFELWCWRRLLRVPWTARRSNRSILKEINPEYSLKGLMLKLKL